MQHEDESSTHGPVRRGLLVAICGIDGSGKTTQEVLVGEWFRAKTRRLLITQQPTPWFRQMPEVREYLDSGEDVLGMPGLALLAATDRQRHVRGVIIPALESGVDVVCNRYVYSTYAYFMARGLSLSFIKQINPNVPLPDLTVLLSMPAHLALERVRQRDGRVVKFEEQRVEFMAQVARNFLTVADDSFLILDARLPPERIQQLIRLRLEALVAAHGGQLETVASQAEPSSQVKLLNELRSAPDGNAIARVNTSEGSGLREAAMPYKCEDSLAHGLRLAESE